MNPKQHLYSRSHHYKAHLDFDASKSAPVFFTTTFVITTTESECVIWAFEVNGTVGPSTYGCATSGTNIIIKTAAETLTAPITALYATLPSSSSSSGKGRGVATRPSPANSIPPTN